MDKLYIGLFGQVNSGKSSILNKLAGQNIAIVSSHKGTTTDTVKKPLELAGVGATVLVDTAGLGDKTPLGKARIKKTMATINLIDTAIVVISCGYISKEIKALIKELKIKNKQILVINNKSDLKTFKTVEIPNIKVINFSCKNDSPEKILTEIRTLKKPSQNILLDDIISAGQTVVLVMPQDSEAPKGRLILPQQQLIRNILDLHALSVSIQPSELAATLKLPIKFDLVVTDSQVFKEVSKIVPKDIPLTSFSILYARLKNDFKKTLAATQKIATLKDGDTVLILESCTHTTPTCDDIGRVKLPKALTQKSGKKLKFELISGINPLPKNLNKYALAVQCGGCVLTRTQVLARSKALREKGVPVTNYGLALAYCQGILERVTEIFKK